MAERALARVETLRARHASALAAAVTLAQVYEFRSYFGGSARAPMPLAAWRAMPRDGLAIEPLRAACQELLQGFSDHSAPAEVVEDCHNADLLTRTNLRAYAEEDVAYARHHLQRVASRLRRHGVVSHADWHALHNPQSLARSQERAIAHIEALLGASLTPSSLLVPGRTEIDKAVQPSMRRRYMPRVPNPLPAVLQKVVRHQVKSAGLLFLAHDALLHQTAPGEVDEEGTPMRSFWSMRILARQPKATWCRVYYGRIYADDSSWSAPPLKAPTTLFTISSCAHDKPERRPKRKRGAR